MLKLERILVPIDFSAGSLIAASHAGALARRFHAEVTLLHVNEFLVIHPLTGPLGFGITSWEALRSEHITARQKQLDEFGATELAGVAVKRLVCSGDPARLIVERAREDKSDLVLVPTRGVGSFRRFLLGSVTAKVLHDADCPVWTGAHRTEAPAHSPPDIRHVMCATDFGQQSSTALRWAAAFAAELGAKLTVVHVLLDIPLGLPDTRPLQWHAEVDRGANERCHALLLDAGVQADVLVISGSDIPRALSTAAKEKAAGLLVIGRSCAGAAPKRLGGRTYDIICNAPCPVVSI